MENVTSHIIRNSERGLEATVDDGSDVAQLGKRGCATTCRSSDWYAYPTDSVAHKDVPYYNAK